MHQAELFPVDAPDFGIGNDDAMRTAIRQILGVIAELDRAMTVARLRAARERTVAHCQLKQPWYAGRVGGAAARVGGLVCSPTMLPRSSERGRPKRLRSAKLTKPQQCFDSAGIEAGVHADQQVFQHR